MRNVVGVAALFAIVSATSILPHARASGGQASAGEDGRVLFASYCASCHGRNGHGDGPVADNLRVRPMDLTQLARQNGGMFPAERARRVIDGREARVRAHGSIEMPVWGDAFIKREGLSEPAARARIAAIVRYLDSIQERSGH